jgi:hypothetical protein
MAEKWTRRRLTAEFKAHAVKGGPQGRTERPKYHFGRIGLQRLRWRAMPSA